MASQLWFEFNDLCRCVCKLDMGEANPELNTYWCTGPVIPDYMQHIDVMELYCPDGGDVSRRLGRLGQKPSLRYISFQETMFALTLVPRHSGDPRALRPHDDENPLGTWPQLTFHMQS